MPHSSGNMSLIAHVDPHNGSVATLVHWIGGASASMARARRGRAKCCSQSWSPKIDLTSVPTRVILPDVGQPMMKAKPIQRDELHADTTRLKLTSDCALTRCATAPDLSAGLRDNLPVDACDVYSKDGGRAFAHSMGSAEMHCFALCIVRPASCTERVRS